MTLTIDVTQDNIDMGDPRCRTCPIALAINPLLAEGHSTRVIGLCGSIPAIVSLWIKAQVRYKTKLPDSCGYFIDKFDQGHSVKPFRFEVNIPSKFLRITDATTNTE